MCFMDTPEAEPGGASGGGRPHRGKISLKVLYISTAKMANPAPVSLFTGNLI